MEKIILISAILIVTFVLFGKGLKSGTDNKNKKSVFDYINENIDEEGKLREEKQNLPFYEKGSEGIIWAPGAMDGVLSHHSSLDNSDDIAKQIAINIKQIATTNKLQNKEKVYELIKKNQVIGWLDKSINYIIEYNTTNSDYLKGFARELAFNSDNIEAVKFGIALIGISKDVDSKKKILILAKHEEFTLYVIVAISNMEKDSENDIWTIAKSVNGWGRISAVERLKDTKSPEIKRWILLEGYKNSVMYEYLAYISATTGNLYSMVKNENISEEELSAASDIIEALINGGPAEGINEYEDGCNVIKEYLERIKKRRNHVKYLFTAESIFDLVDNNEFLSPELKKIGWDENSIKKIHLVSFEIKNDNSWKKLFEEMKSNVNDENIYELDRMAHILKMNLYDFYVGRIKTNPLNQMNWYFIMRYADETNIENIIKIAESTINFKEIEGKPNKDLMLGDKYAIFNIADYILQDLDKYPQKGRNIIIIGLRSISIRNRNMAVRALEKWDIKSDRDIINELKKLEVIEPDDELRNKIKNILK